MRILALTCLIITICAPLLADEKRIETQTIEHDGISLKSGGRNGYTIAVDGVPFSDSASLALVDPAWKLSYYGYGDDKLRIHNAQETLLPDGGRQLVIPLRSSRNNVMQGTQTLQLLSERRLRIAIDIRMTSNTPAVIENRLASITEGWITNCHYSAVMQDGTTTAGQTPRWALGETPSVTTLLKGIREATIQSPRGPLTISTSGPATMSLVDYRRNEWAQGERYYWFGILGSPVPRDDVFRYSVTFQFPRQDSNVQSKAARPTQTLISGESTPSVFQIPPPIDQIIPTPKQITWHNESLPVGKEITVSLEVTPTTAPATGDNPGHSNWPPENLLSDSRKIVQQFSDRLQRTYGLTAKLTSDPKQALVNFKFSPDHNLNPSQSEECYDIKFNDSHAIINPSTATGLRNALNTLEQLIRIKADGTAALRQADIFDYPSLPFRGIHFFTGKDARDLQLKMISEILAPLKINRLIYQVDYLKWDSQPQIHSDMLGMDKADGKAVADKAESLGIDVIPLINTFGHSEWLLQRPVMRYLADDPNDAYAYDPSNPKVYEICEGIYREAIELFHPDIMHIGHDEVSLDGFPKKPENKAIGATQLLINDTVHYYKFLKKLGIRTMIWGDMFLAPEEAPDATLAPTIEEAKRRRSLLPKDIMIADWHYKSAPVDEYKSLEIFNKTGFEAIACTWNAPDNIVRFAKAAANQRENTTSTLGLIQTTWAGYSFDEESLVNSIEQYTAYVLAAQAAWTGGAADSKDVPFDFTNEFLRRWNGQLAGGAESGWLANLNSVANTTLNPDRLSLADSAFNNFKPGQTAMDGYTFNLPEIAGQPAALRLGGAWDKNTEQTPTQISLNFGDKAPASALYFAMATPLAAPDGSPIGTATVSLDDGSTSSVNFRYGSNILSIADHRQTLLAPLIWKSADLLPGQGAAAIHLYRWQNPEPSRKVQSIEFTSSPNGPGMMIFGISGAE